MTFFSFSLAFGYSSCDSCVLDSKFKLYAFCCQYTHHGGDWEIKWSVPWFDCDESLTFYGLNLNLGYFSCFTPICLCGESRLLVSWCVGDRCGMTDIDNDVGRSRRPGAEDRGWSSTGRVLGDRTIGRSGDAMCGLYRAQWDEEREFLGLASKPRSTISTGLASKPLARVFQFGPQSQQLRFDDLAHKITAMISWFGPQNQVGGGLLVCASKSMSGWRWCEDMCRHLVACFIAKQVGIGFPSLASRLAKARREWCTWHHRRGCIEMKAKTDRSMWQAVSDSSTPILLFSLY
jgi:hypothetical protein